MIVMQLNITPYVQPVVVTRISASSQTQADSLPSTSHSVFGSVGSN